MPKIIAPLTDTAIRQIKPTNKPRRLFDGKQVGLHLLIQPSGAKLWRLRYTFNREEKRISLGKYPDISLEQARSLAAKNKEHIKSGVDPSAPVVINTFEAVAKKFVDWKSTVLLRSGSTIRKYNECLKNDLLPALGKKDITTIHAIDVVPLLETINKRSNSLARKDQELIAMIIKYAVQRGYRPPYTHIDLSGVIVRKPPKPKKIPGSVTEAFKKIDKYPESVMRHAMRLQFFCFLRASETMGAKWCEIDFKTKEWIIPAHRMKMKRPHVVPLAQEAIKNLKELKALTGSTPYLFPSAHNDAPMVRDALSKAFRSTDLGIVPHGCRTVAGTWARNNQFPPHIIEAQLSHVEANQVAAAYQDKPHLMYLNERKKLMQAWAGYLTKS